MENLHEGAGLRYPLLAAVEASMVSFVSVESVPSRQRGYAVTHHV